MTGRLAGRMAIVTGAASGIGRAIALRFAREGAQMVLVDIRGAVPARSSPTDSIPVSTEEAILLEGGHARTIEADLTRPTDVNALFDTARRDNARIDIVVSNAGTFTGAPLLDTGPDRWDREMDLNLRSHYLVNRRAIAIMCDQEDINGVRGRVINMASQLGLTAPPGHLTYAVAKAGIAHMTRQLAVDYARRGILVNALAPGRIITGYHPGEAEYLRVGTVDDATRYSLERTPFPRLGRPEDVAGAAMYLASDDCSFTSGHILTVDGGWTAY